MNELSGAFVYAIEKGEDINKIKVAFLNAGYPLQIVEEAFQEAQQIKKSITEPTKQSIPRLEEKSNSINENKSSDRGKIFLLVGILVVLIFALGVLVYFLFLGGKNV
ncbi:MAG: hypothetical protein QW273_03505 [Candidatus Pacearchaeota archaeon]